jgi:hypothetical protein
MASPSPSQPSIDAPDPFVAYSRTLYDYTFNLWKESKRVEQENLQRGAEGKESGGRKEEKIPKKE